jgi:hypothetical protein
MSDIEGPKPLTPNEMNNLRSAIADQEVEVSQEEAERI